MKDNRKVKISKAGFGCVIANGNAFSIEDKGTFYKVISLASKEVTAVAYSVDEAVMECVRKLRLHNASKKFIAVNKKFHGTM